MSVNPQNDLTNYITQWNQANQTYNQDYGSLITMIQNMLLLCKQGGEGTEEAFQVAEMGVMPTAMTVQGDQMGQLAASMNIGAACQEFTTGSQNDINGGTTMTTAQAQQFLQYLQQLYDAVKAEMNLPANQQWLDPNTAQSILASLVSISQEFVPGSNPDTLNTPANAALVANDITNWTSNPSSTYGDETGQQHIQNLQSDFQSWNNTESAQSQSLQAQEQFCSNTFNQYMNACTTVFQAAQKQAQNFVQNQKTQ